MLDLPADGGDQLPVVLGQQVQVGCPLGLGDQLRPSIPIHGFSDHEHREK